ncbi:MAG: hypothetical protein JKY55_09915 [Aliivibrio sp.]|uniref:hypothetical protein n=1 Tax=Aliivibrio sp. TaxID=1872443 RepID=UPI001A647F15|nr:hypothetical protein [Aliivibrio sp.]
MQFIDHLSLDSKTEFIEFWAQKYNDANELKYTNNIGKPFTNYSINELFEWKNGSKISKLKLASIRKNYPLNPTAGLEERYLNHPNDGGAIWNIFYLHCINQQKYPIFDQHNYRAMVFLKTQKVIEIPKSDKQKYELYKNEFIPFFSQFIGIDSRQVDMALFTFGQFLKKVKIYC